MKNRIWIFTIFLSCSVFAQRDAARMIVQSGHFDEIKSLAVSPNGKWVASGGKDHLVVLYDVKTGLQMDVLKGLKDWVNHVEFTRDNKRVIGLCNYSTNYWSGIRVWDVLTGTLAYSIDKPECGHIKSFRQCGAANRLVVKIEGSDCMNFQIHELSTGKLLKEITFDRNVTEHWAVSADAKTIVFEDTETANVNVLNVATGTIVGDFHVNELDHVTTREYEMAYISNDGKFYHRSLELAKWLKINLATGEIVRTQFNDLPAGSSIDDMHPNASRSRIYVNYGSHIRIGELPNVKLGERIELSIPYASLSAACHEKNFMAFAYQRNVYFYDVIHKKVVREFIASPCKPLQAVFSNNSRMVAIADYYTPVKIWDLQSADAVKTFSKIDLNSERFQDLMAFSPDDKVLFTGGGHPELVHIPTIESKRYYDHFYYHVSSSHHSGDGDRKVNKDFSTVLYGKTQYELSTGRNLCQYEWGSHAGSLHYSRDGKYVYQYTHSYEDDSVKIFLHNASDCSTGITYKIPDKYKRGVVTVANDSKSIAVAGTGIAVADFSTGKVLYYYKREDITQKNPEFTPELDCSALDFSPDGKMLAVADETTNSIGIFSVETGKVKFILRGHDDKVYSLTYSPDGKKIVSVGEDKKIMLWNVETGKLDATFVPVDETDYVLFTPDNYYMCSKAGVKGVAYRVKNKMFKAEQFDLRQNRPDTVLQRLGYATKFSIKMYKKAWKKRIQRAGYTEEMLGSDYDIPAVEILKSDEIPSSVSQNTFSFDIQLTDSLHTLSKYNVYINDVPVYGSKGVDISAEKIRKSNRTINLDLSHGRNVIQVTAFNDRGTESIRESIEISCTRRPEANPDLYILAIGVSSYKDKTRDLKFAAKDAKDLTSFLKNNSKSFDSVHVKLISGTEATRLNVLAARSFFQKADINDEVILYFSGHGLLNDDLNYYMAMYDVDFNKPESGGLPYEEFESLIDNIPSRNRLVLLDACHSGEVDREETMVNSAATAINVTSGARSGGVVVKPKVGLKNTLGLMRELFTETQKGSGATILSAAGGMEYALESADWNNGVFTYAILDALKDNKADSNNDRVVRVSELCFYVSKKVYRLTRGAQSPNARKENTQNNFIVR